jgi:trimeric autotransporter adhesin
MAARVQKPLWPFVLNRAIDQAQGLVGWWPGGPSGGQRLFDMSGRGNHGTINGTIPTTGVWATGNGGDKSSLLLDGSTNSVTALDGRFPSGSAARTVSVWFKYTSYTGEYAALFGYGARSSLQWWALILDNNKLDGNLFGFDLESTATYNDSKWHLGVYSWDGTIRRLYADGQLVNSTAANTPNTVLSSLIIGSDSSNERFHGNIEDCRIYNRALDASEVAAMYEPSTRWQLRYQPGRTRWFLGKAATSHLLMKRRRYAS